MAHGLRRDLELLEALCSQEAVTQFGLGVNRIAQLCQRQKSQVSRALAGLLQAGLVERDPETLAYRCGWRLFDLAAATRDSQLVQSARPCLEELAASLGRPAYLCALRGSGVTVLVAEPVAFQGRCVVKEGTAAAALHTAPGRVLMSESAEPAVRSTWDQTPAVPHTAGLDQVLAHLRQIRAAGYAHLGGEYRNGLGGIAAPVRDFTTRMVAAVSVPAHPDRVTSQEDAVIRATQRCAAQLSYAMGYAEPARRVRSSMVTTSRPCTTPGCSGAVLV
ncbi:IclR family transcriptional regulator [Streptomyces sp. NPDC085932]|uniref:IclR family transcriptional regulator n=1 Tax=Streptomyces sp. NPDC085932 TaxID=3365741 RepID=UPI0037D5E490